MRYSSLVTNNILARSVSSVARVEVDREGREQRPAPRGDGRTAPCPIPAVGHEPAHWIAENDGRASRTAMAAASGPDESTVPALIGSLVVDLPADLAADAEEAAAELARFDEHARARLGRDSPALGPMSAILLRTESASSSQIENLTAGARQLALS